MFLAKDNHIRWKFLGAIFALLVGFCGVGVFWLDKTILEFFRNFEFVAWHIFDSMFSFKIWIIASFAVFAVAAFINRIIFQRSFSSIFADMRRGLKGTWDNAIIAKVQRAAFSVFCSVMGAGAVAGVLKIAIGRMRPVVWEALGQTGFYPFRTEWVFHSMPSGHTAASFAGLVMIGLLFPRWKFLTWTLAIVIGISRICIGEHWPSDVLLGALIGMVSADAIKNLLRSKN